MSRRRRSEEERDTPSARFFSVVRTARRRFLSAIERTEQALSASFARIETEVQAQARAVLSMPDLPASQEIERRVGDAFRRELRNREQAIRDGARDVARQGRDTAQRAGRAAFPTEEQPTPESDAVTDRRAERRLSTVDGRGLNLSSRMRSNDAATVQRIREDIQSAHRLGETVDELADRIYRATDTSVALPRALRDLDDYIAGRMTERDRRGRVSTVTPTPEGLKGMARDLKDYAKRLSAEQTRPAMNAMIRAAETGKFEAVQKQMKYWVRDRAMYQARVVARTELAAAHEEAFQASAEEQPWNKGLRWTLSSAHPRPDVCDTFANQNVDGLGPGGYEFANAPSRPAHPNCLCFTTAIIDDAHMKRRLARLRGEPEPPEAYRDDNIQDASAWMRSRSEAFQNQLLGPTRAELFRKGSDQVFNRDGSTRPVWQATGGDNPARNADIQNARSSARRESAAEMDPFSEAGSRSR